jgi:hypothetical protein
MHHLRLRFGENIEDTVRRRVTYAFSVFCAVYGYQPTEFPEVPTVCYGAKPMGPLDIPLHSGYRPRNQYEPFSPPQFVEIDPAINCGCKLLQFPCFHPPRGATPDWLGEIFEWLSGTYDLTVQTVDSVGRIPFEASLQGKFNLDLLVPYAAVAMKGLNDQIRRALNQNWPAAPLSPWPGLSGSAVAATHDVDFLPTSRLAKLVRHFKDTIDAALIYQQPARAISAFQLLFGAVRANAGENIEPLLRLEARQGIRSTFNFICRNSHRRDGGYEVNSPVVRQLMRTIASSHREIGVHGSYTSLEGKGRLAQEYDTLRGLGYAANGGRQHWMRYRTQTDLFDELRAAGAAYDTSLGDAWRCGFRNGACFPFPPYDFSTESAYPILELPVVMQDVVLLPQLMSNRPALEFCRSILETTRSFGWGGVSILWHDPIFQLSPALGKLYWELKEDRDSWMPAGELARAIWPRYQNAGLLPAWPIPETGISEVSVSSLLETPQPNH